MEAVVSIWIAPVPRSQQKAAAPLPAPHNLQSVLKLERVNAPKQARSEQRLQDILQALEALLDGRPFQDITIPDIAARAGCVTASIYARFKNKTSILVALHESMLERQLAQIDQSMQAERHAALSLDESILAICRNLVRYYARQRNLLRAAFLLDDREIYERAATVMRYISGKIAVIVAAKAGVGKGATPVARRVDLATRAVFGLLQQRMVFQSAAPGVYQPAGDDEMAQELATLFKSVLAAAASGPSRPGKRNAGGGHA